MSSLQFTPDTRITPSDRVEVPTAYREELSEVLTIEDEGDDGTVDACEIDVERLLDVLIFYSSMERLRFGWRRLESDGGQ